jgi:hypothetical protein
MQPLSPILPGHLILSISALSLSTFNKDNLEQIFFRFKTVLHALHFI